ncbi:MAG: cation:proton antiporter [Hyphomicrobiales bacterium]
MAEHATDLTGIAVIMTLAVLLGLMFMHLRQPAIVGYILTGLVLGPTGFGLVSNTESITVLAELGVIMLLFLIGMEISLRAFVLVLKPAAITALAQIAIALAVTFLFRAMLGWSVAAAVVLAFIVALSSTAVAMKMLEEIGELRSHTGRITIGVLVAQDIAVVPMMLLVASFAGDGGDWGVVLVKLVVAVAGLGLLIRLLVRRGKFAMPFTDVVRGRVDIIALASIAFCFGAAALSGVFGLSPAYGAFIAGLVIASSTLRVEAIRATEPVQSVLMVVFFLSIGLLIDLDYLLANLGSVLAFVLGVTVTKTIVNIALLRLVGQPWERAFPGGLIMAQIGEFSFVLAAAGWQVGALDYDGYRLAIAVIAISLLISPLWMVTVRRFHEIAVDGITDLRAALGEVYAEEIGGFGRRVQIVRVLPYLARRRSRALRRGWRRSRVERAMRLKMRDAATDTNALALMATADAYPPEDEERGIRMPHPHPGPDT